MLSFSSLVPSFHTDKQQGGLPLKAVYRDSVVGIRYLDSSTGTFRRFQITFSSTSEASQFVDSISSVCPCKANNAASPPAPQIMPPAPSIVPPSLLNPTNTTGSVHLAHDLPFPHHVSHHAFPTSWRKLLRVCVIGHDQTNVLFPVLMNHAQISSSPPPPPSGQPSFHFNASQTNFHSHSQLSSPRTHTPTSTQPRPEQPCYSPSSSSVTMGSSAPFTQTSVVSENIRDGSLMSRPRATKETAEKDIQTADPFVFALQEATSLYHLSHGSLEKLVGDVVREDGFVHLVGDLGPLLIIL
ncbi:hypothetical protein BDP27DRAFT_1420315 [Rhodocollybia butyracea]|uniref:Uncharacterized protein n=1 Tax=Rhodocollybia butyracea TaxID=206335 RepID=A0A9P5U8K1_9AGAR|nr:hypothetical protein BDP27DRAFT_1420315 [Rhodocollybia butyracea]